jgi:hypothetical protein
MVRFSIHFFPRKSSIPMLLTLLQPPNCASLARPTTQFRTRIRCVTMLAAEMQVRDSTTMYDQRMACPWRQFADCHWGGQVISSRRRFQTKKADVAEHPKVLHQVGLLCHQSPGHDRVTIYLVVRRHQPSGVNSQRRPVERYSTVCRPEHKQLSVYFGDSLRQSLRPRIGKFQHQYRPAYVQIR